MSKKFKYTNINESGYLANSDEYEEYGDEFEYEVDNKRIVEALAYLINCDYFENTIKEERLKTFIEELDLVDVLEECYEEDLKDYFEEDAFNSIR